ncbi:type II secretion system protein [Collimonas silvisoli]|uniref:type II secretion system protein n=1 Tax=Collimonas silvisoli TaxID=2825884 RepID=UPI001B8C664C|nr:type II secretion system protein [Collimonas silvisoli]
MIPLPPLPLIKRRVRGVVLLALLLTLALMAVALMGAVEVWSVERQRETEAELLYVGDQYRLAIQHYYYAAPGAGKMLPASIDDLLADQRFPTPVRHLRRAYADPVTGEAFELLRNGEQISGVVSSSTKPTIKRSGFSRADSAFEGFETYNQWRFLFSPPVPGKAGRRSQSPSQSLRPPVAIGGKP